LGSAKPATLANNGQRALGGQHQDVVAAHPLAAQQPADTFDGKRRLAAAKRPGQKEFVERLDRR
jgi:hypothetical protein